MNTKQKTLIALEMVKAATVIVEAKGRMLRQAIQKQASRSVHYKLVEQTERELVKSLIPFFKSQIGDIVKQLERTKSSNSSTVLLERVFDPREWKEELTNTILPVLAVGMARAATGQLLAMGIDVRKSRLGLTTKFNPHHDSEGRFATSSGAGGDLVEIRPDTVRYGVGEPIPRKPSGSYTPRREESYYGEARGGVSKETHQFLTDWMDSPTAQPSDSIIKELAKYTPSDSVVLYRGGKSGGKEPYKSWSYDKDVAEGFVGEGEKVMKRRWYPDEILVDFTRLPKAYKDDLEENGMGNSLQEVICAYGPALKHMKDVRKSKQASWFIKSSTATDWLNEHSSDVDLLEAMLEETGLEGYGILTELPHGMKVRIADKLKKSFAQDYWDNISATTGGDAEVILRQGLRDGWSIADMAAQLKESLGGDRYAQIRALNIARTESGNALNGARKGVVEQLRHDLGKQFPIGVSWLSVLGSTTRASHANLDGVPADKNGEWYLAGVNVPWPGHYRLPASERCNCQCSIQTELGLQSDEATEMIQEYYDRIQEGEALAHGLLHKETK